MIKKNAETRRVLSHPGRRNPNRYRIQKISHYDFIAFIFLYSMMPQPEIFEIKQVLKIPQSKIEQRHDLMISMICDRIKNRDKYERMHFFWSYPLQKELGFYEPKYYPKKNSVELYEFWSNDGWLSHERTILRKRMKGCKHKEENILAILNADRWKPVPGNWPHMYIGDKLAVID